jgi:RNA polymerase sigma-70 factor (ECF subfamily)
MELSDEQLIENYRAGDQAAFGVLYDRYVEKIYRFVYYKTFDKEITEDLTSSTFFKALNKIDTLDLSRGTFSSWLYRIARNTIIDHYRSPERATQDIEDIFDLAEDNRTVEELDANAALKTVSTYLKTLTPIQREIVTLRLWEDRSYQEIAAIVGGTEGSVKMAFSRTIRKLREDLGPLAPIALAVLSVSPVTHV